MYFNQQLYVSQVKKKYPPDMEKNQKQERQTRTVAFKKSDDQVSKSTDEKNDQEIGGPKGLEPTRYGDWERKGRCVDF